MPTPTPIPVAKIPVGDVFLTLIQVIQEKKLTETDILLAKSTDTPPIVTNASITTEPLSPGLPQPEESLNGVLIKYGFTPQHIQLDATADVVASLQNGNALIANVPINIKNDRGLISLYSPQVGHYVVIKGVSLKPDGQTPDWVEILNPFNNQYEYYHWDDFISAMKSQGGFFIPTVYNNP